MDLDSLPKGSRTELLRIEPAPATAAAVFDPVRLQLGAAGEDGERLVYCKYRRRVQRFFEKRGIPPDEALDLTQDTFLRVFRGEARLDGREQLEAWLFKIARHVWFNALRSKTALKRAATVVSLDQAQPAEEPREVADAERDALAVAISREQLAALRDALAALPEQMRQCVRFRLKDDLMYGEIAAVMGISIETVKSHLHQAKKRLRHLLEAHFGPLDL
jgi:RNA polymerase sigma factor (sigma-70 family)